MSEGQYVVRPIGRVESPLLDQTTAPKQGDEGSPDAWLVFEPAVRNAHRGREAGAQPAARPVSGWFEAWVSGQAARYG